MFVLVKTIRICLLEKCFMALETLRTLGQLKQECENLGVLVKIVGKEKKEHYVRALRNFYLKKYYVSLDRIPWDLRFMLSIDCPMLCKRYQQCKQDVQDRLWVDDNEYVIEEKLDGVRLLICYNLELNTFSFYSRNNSVKDFLPQNYKGTILTFEKEFKYDKNFILDCELIATNSKTSTVNGRFGTQCETQLQSTTALLALNPEDSKKIQKKNPLKFFVFDCLYDGESLLNESWDDRHLHAEYLVRILKGSGFLCELNPSFYCNKRDFYDSVIDRGGEGVVFKNRNSTYHATTSRTNDQIKLKRNIASTLENDIDAWVSGFVESNPEKGFKDLIGAIEFSVKLRKEDGEIVTHVIGCVSGIPYDLRKNMTVNVDGKVSLNPKYLGRVATISGQNIGARKLTLQHAVLVEWRPDKDILGCEVLEEKELRKLVF